MVRHTHASSTASANAPRHLRHFGALFASLATSAALALTLAAAPMALAAENTPAAGAQSTPVAGMQAASPSRAPQSGAGSATVLVYMNGSDLESQAGEASMDIDEMLKSGIGENANVVIETLGTSQWQGFGIASDHTQRYAVESGELKLVDDSLGQLDTTSPDTLSDFIRWGVENYPADRYILLMWDHGAGPVYGFGYDEFQSDYSALTLDEIQQALEENSDVHFDIIGMDCCIMSSLETCAVLEPFCDYTVLSEDFEPGSGWSYTNWMSKLEQNPGIDTAELGRTIVDDMISDVEANEPGMNATLALIDESKVPALKQAWIDFAYANKDSLLESNYSQEAEWKRGDESAAESSEQKPGAMDGYGSWSDTGDAIDYDNWGSLEDWASLWDYWDSDASYVTMTDYFVTDILQVASSIDSDKADALKSAVNDAIVHYGATEGETGMTGLGVTLPYGDAEFYDQLKTVFAACEIDGDYIDWLEAFVDAPGANSYYDYGSNAGSVSGVDAYGYGDDSYGYDSYGYGNGYDYGNGYGDGYGYGYGDGYGDTYGYDDGYGDGYGDGSGYGYGNSYAPGESGWLYSYGPFEGLTGQIAA